MAAALPQIKIQTQSTKPRRRRFRETTISSSVASAAVDADDESVVSIERKLDSPTVVSPDNSWCCPVSKAKEMESNSHFNGDAAAAAAVSAFPSLFSKFNSALTAGLLNPMSPPPSVDKTRSSPTLFEMMANEPDCVPRSQIPAAVTATNLPRTQISAQDKHALLQQRLSELLYCRSPGNMFNDPASSDTKLTLSSIDGLVISMNVHRQILVAHSRFFAGKLSERWSRQLPRSPNPCAVEISDCEDIEIYIETIRLMYCKDLRKKLMKEDVSRVLGILKVSSTIGFDAGVLSCLEYLEAAPWAEEEEEKIASLLSELRLEGVGAIEVLKRVSTDTFINENIETHNEQILLKLLHVVLEGKDEKARKEMKTLVSKMLRENSSQADLKKESLYSAVQDCLKSLNKNISNSSDFAKIARNADNLHWVLEILIDRQMAEDFIKIWISQEEIAEFHSNITPVHRFEISRITSRLFVAIGKGQVLVSKEDRFKLLKIWLVPLR